MKKTLLLTAALSLCACSSEKFTMVTTTENAQKDGQDENVTITAGKKQITVNVPANSLSTVVM